MRAADQQFERRIGHEFRNPELLARALTHRSYRNDRPPDVAALTADNEQLEFLGDAILGFVVSEALVLAHPDAPEGQLSPRKAEFINTNHLYACAQNVGIGEVLRLGRGEERSGGRQRRTLLADAVEAVIAAIYLDADIDAARRFIHEHVLAGKHQDARYTMNFKSLLQEQVLGKGLPVPRYVIVETGGPEHAKEFTVEVRVGDGFASRGKGSSKKAASQLAAEAMLMKLGTTVGQESPPASTPSVSRVIEQR